MKGKKAEGKALPSLLGASGGVAKPKIKHDDAKKAKDFMEDIFGEAKRTKAQDVNPESAAKAKRNTPVAEKQQKAKGSKGVSNVNDLFGKEAEARKKTEEGWNIYTEDELGLNKQGGDTPLCPFDCDCCY